MQVAAPTEKSKPAILTDRGNNSAPIKHLAPVLDAAHFLPPAKSMPREQFPWIVARKPSARGVIADPGLKKLYFMGSVVGVSAAHRADPVRRRDGGDPPRLRASATSAAWAIRGAVSALSQSLYGGSSAPMVHSPCSLIAAAPMMRLMLIAGAGAPALARQAIALLFCRPLPFRAERSRGRQSKHDRL
jgi:hypothetical protein